MAERKLVQGLIIKERIDTPHRFHGQLRDRRRLLASGLALRGLSNIGKFEEVAPRMGVIWSTR